VGLCLAAMDNIQVSAQRRVSRVGLTLIAGPAQVVAFVFALCPRITAAADSARTARDHLCPDILLFNVSAILYTRV